MGGNNHSGGYATMQMVICPRCGLKAKKGYRQIRYDGGVCSNNIRCDARAAKRKART